MKSQRLFFLFIILLLFVWAVSCDQPSTDCVDLDGDGYGDNCAAGNDCDDNNQYINPGMPETCNGIADDNCNGTIDEGCSCVNGAARDCGSDEGECEPGVQYCIEGAWLDICIGGILPGDEICDGLDNDCDGDVDENVLPEICDGLDNDCDGDIDEDFTALGEYCEAGMGECVAGGQYVCSPDGAGVECDAAPGDMTEEICDGLDNDCDGETDEDFLDLGSACQSGMGVCISDGVYVCSLDGAGVECNAVPGEPSVELCDGLDNDCDGAIDESFPLLGQPCIEGIGQCGTEGTYLCSGDGLGTYCDAVPGSPSVEICDGLDNDCDGETDEGLTDNNPSCSADQFYIGFVKGDEGSDTITETGYNEEWFRLDITEDNDSIVYLSATITLYSPPGMDFDLYVWCNNCSGSFAGSSEVAGQYGHYDTVSVRTNDDWGSIDDFTVFVEIRYFSSTSCSNNWELSISGNTTVSNETCN